MVMKGRLLPACNDIVRPRGNSVCGIQFRKIPKTGRTDAGFDNSVRGASLPGRARRAHRCEVCHSEAMETALIVGGRRSHPPPTRCDRLELPCWIGYAAEMPLCGRNAALRPKCRPGRLGGYARTPALRRQLFSPMVPTLKAYPTRKRDRPSIAVALPVNS
jgi:hypothetical protein